MTEFPPVRDRGPQPLVHSTSIFLQPWPSESENCASLSSFQGRPGKALNSLTHGDPGFKRQPSDHRKLQAGRSSVPPRSATWGNGRQVWHRSICRSIWSPVPFALPTRGGKAMREPVLDVVPGVEAGSIWRSGRAPPERCPITCLLGFRQFSLRSRFMRRQIKASRVSGSKASGLGNITDHGVRAAFRSRLAAKPKWGRGRGVRAKHSRNPDYTWHKPLGQLAR